jgi:hypothetical protein
MLMKEARAAGYNSAALLVAFFGKMSPQRREALPDAMRVVSFTHPRRGWRGGRGITSAHALRIK